MKKGEEERRLDHCIFMGWLDKRSMLRTHGITVL